MSSFNEAQCQAGFAASIGMALIGARKCRRVSISAHQPRRPVVVVSVMADRDAARSSAVERPGRH